MHGAVVLVLDCRSAHRTERTDSRGRDRKGELRAAVPQRDDAGSTAGMAHGGVLRHLRAGDAAGRESVEAAVARAGAAHHAAARAVHGGRGGAVRVARGARRDDSA
ncbi:hypothetical protein FGB62_110g12 [Gracilaria domingensis]|nr:hypothetical protein FGB62_110g12 [Gracilaria domingensis]